MTMQAQRSNKTGSTERRSAFTLIELLVVMGIIAVLAGAVLVAAGSVLEGQKVRNTRTVLQVVSDAVEEFKREQQQRATITKDPDYKKRFDLYPPDEIDWFTTLISTTKRKAQSFAPGGALVAPGPGSKNGYDAMRFYTDGTEDDFLEYRDQVAMIIAIENLGDASAAILDRLDRRYRKTVVNPASATGDDPAVFLDRPSPGTPLPNTIWDSGDKQVDYIIDAWGTPISYLAQRDFKRTNRPDATVSNNHPTWNEASTEIIKLNRGQPLIFSYGPDGPEQLVKEVMMGEAGDKSGIASLTGDFEADERPVTEHGRTTHLMNADNVYLDPQFNEKLLGEHKQAAP